MKRKVSVINTFFKKTKGKDELQIGRTSFADISKAILSERFVFVLYIRVIPNIKEDSYDNFDELDEESINKNWYNNVTSVGQIRYLKIFLP